MPVPIGLALLERYLNYARVWPVLSPRVRRTVTLEVRMLCRGGYYFTPLVERIAQVSRRPRTLLLHDTLLVMSVCPPYKTRLWAPEVMERGWDALDAFPGHGGMVTAPAA